jgi:flagellar hook assembly protein FlgD
MNYPNPFKEQTDFTYILSQPAEEVLIKIFTLSGRMIKTIRKAPTNQNFNSIQWDGKDEDGDKVSNGVYIYKIIAKDSGNRASEATDKLVIIR